LKEQFTYFQTDISQIEPPKAFDFPFYYRPHKLARLAAEELQAYLKTQKDWFHDFGMRPDSAPKACGKMFGVLVVRNAQGELGYLKAFSGKMAETNVLDPFVPPVFDTLVEGDFFKTGEAELNVINRRLEALQADPELEQIEQALKAHQLAAEKHLAEQRAFNKMAKQQRDKRRKAAKAKLDEKAYQLLEQELKAESTHYSYQLKKLKQALEEEEAILLSKIEPYRREIAQLKEARKKKSAGLQVQIFKEFQFLNAHHERESLYTIFKNTLNENPPAGAGDCAAPKLLHFAYQHQLQPICMAEFWWGRPPRNEVRKHQQFYTSCRGKCEPILGHMLQGLKVQENPMLQQSEGPKEIPVVYEDEHLVVINKPAEFLSVPGKTVTDSVYTRMKEKYPEASGPLIVHRLDMSTSGILLIPKSRAAHKNLQAQFKRRSIKKKYLALLEGDLGGEEGLINLPLRVDLDDRPRQLVCYDYGKAAVTKWKVLERRAGETLVQFEPITGRTHQLRVHAAHADGLGIAIKGDDLYGNPADRLYLHAAEIRFAHPISGESIELQAPISWGPVL
jgi:tRNA pseudouridine32 synthase/23S rRNA pseudouridine746 synthase